LFTNHRKGVEPHRNSKSLQQDFNETGSRNKELSQEDLRFLHLLNKNIKQDSEGFYQMPLPFKSENLALPNNEEVVKKCFGQLCHRFDRDPSYFAQYKAFMDNVVKSGDVEEVPKGVPKMVCAPPWCHAP
jgi:hypothetical protein